MLRREDVPADVWPERDDFPGAEYLEVGWGDRAFYQAPRGTWDYPPLDRPITGDEYARAGAVADKYGLRRRDRPRRQGATGGATGTP